MAKFYQRLQTYTLSNWELIGIAITGLLIRLYNLTAISLWHDEAFSALLIKYSWGEMIHRIGLDVHPPMYYIFLRFWHYVFGNSLLSLRGMSVFFGVATIIAVYYFTLYVFGNKRAAIIAALLVAINPFQVQYVTEARMYTMGAFFAITAAHALVCALRNQKLFYANQINTGSKKVFLYPYALFVLCSIILIYTHYYLLFTVAALGLYGFWYHFQNYRFTFKRYGWIVLSGLTIGISFLPWLKIFIFQYAQVGAGYWIPPMDRWSIPDTIWRIMLSAENLIRFPLPDWVFGYLQSSGDPSAESNNLLPLGHTEI